MPETAAKLIGQLDLAPARPLIICDVDEVVVRFLDGFERFLESEGLWLDAASFSLSGNVRRTCDGRAVTQERLEMLFQDFFPRYTASLEPVEGASEALRRLSQKCQIIMLTNLAHAYFGLRRQNLDRHDFPYPLITNQGPKGPAVRQLASNITEPVFFIDDIPQYHASVREHAPHVHLIHFIADERFARHAPVVEAAALKTAKWAEVEDYITTTLNGPEHD